MLAAGLREILAGRRDELVVERLDTRSSPPACCRIVARSLGDDQPGACVTRALLPAVRPPAEWSGGLGRQAALIINAAAEGIYGLDRAGRTTFVNPAAASLLGYNVDELTDQALHDVIHHTRNDGTSYPWRDCPVVTALEDGAVHRVTGEVFWRKDGSSFPVEYTSTPIWESGQITGAVVSFRDVAKRVRAEQEQRRLLREAEAAEARFRGLLEQAPDGIVICDGKGRISLVNREAEQLFGYARGELVGQSIEQLVPERFRKQHVAYRTRYCSDPVTRPLLHGTPLVGRRADGTEFPAEISLSPMGRGEQLVVTSVIRDATERQH
ncbi:MAG: PAS domain S-box protein, partial [Chloroflexi bacterium]|nr:PAS domain S-box protein [Chloroflexota bacterium]